MHCGSGIERGASWRQVTPGEACGGGQRVGMCGVTVRATVCGVTA